MNMALADIEERRRALGLDQAGEQDPLTQVVDQVNAPAPTPAPAPVAAPLPAVPTPSPYGADLSDAALQRAYAQKREDAELGTFINIGRNAANVVGNKMPQYTPPPTTDIEEVQTRRQGIDQEFKAREARDMASSQSPEARLRQSLAKPLAEGAGISQEQLYGVPADQLPAALDYLKGQLAIKARSAGRKPDESAAMLKMVPFLKAQYGWDDATTQNVVDSISAGLSSKMFKDVAAPPAMEDKKAGNHMEQTRYVQGETNTRADKAINYRNSRDVADDVSEMGKQISDTTAAVKTSLGKVLPLIAQAKAKYGEIPGTGLIEDFIGKNRLTSAYLNSPEQKEIRGLVESMNILNRTDITGAAFGEKEADDLRRAYADLLQSDNLEQSLQRLQEKVDAAIKKHVLTKRPEAQAAFFERLPELRPSGVKVTPSSTPATPSGAAVQDEPARADLAAMEWLASPAAKSPANAGKAARISAKLKARGFDVRIK